MTTIFRLLPILLFGQLPVLTVGAAVFREDMPDAPFGFCDAWLEEAFEEFRLLNEGYSLQTRPVEQRLGRIRSDLRRQRPPARMVRLLLEERVLEDSLERMQTEYQLKVVRLRYRKSVEIVKMLYEKILGMDHHFSSMLVQQELSNLSNPHHYPEFEAARAGIEDKIKRRYGFVLPDLLSGNPFVSASFTLLGMMLGGGDAAGKRERTETVACVLDLTVRLHTDLNTIHYETAYLRDANLTLKRDCEILFADCARQVGYTLPLEQCRGSDDWEKLFALLDGVVLRSLAPQPGAVEANPSAQVERNLQFAVDRVVLFINRYADFVNAGNEYYRKFDRMTSGYSTDDPCNKTLPEAFLQLRSDIGQMLEKFDSAYRMPEVQGSKLKDLLYGVPE